MQQPEGHFHTGESQRFRDDEPLSAADELAASAAVEHEIVKTLFDLGRQVTAVLDLDDLLTKIPVLIGRLISFEAFAVYLLDERRGELKVRLLGRVSGRATSRSA